MNAKLAEMFKRITAEVVPLSEMLSGMAAGAGQTMEPASHYHGKPGNSADNRNDILDRYAVFIGSMQNSLTVQFKVTPAQALACIAKACSELQALGMMDPLPAQISTLALAKWQGQAATCQLGGFACKVCADKYASTLKAGSV